MIRPGRDAAVPTSRADDRASSTFLSRSTLMQLRRIVHAHREGWLLEDRVARVGQLVAEEGRRDGASTTALLLALDGAWAGIRDVQRLEPERARDLLRRLVAACIHACYVELPAEEGAGDRGAAGRGASDGAPVDRRPSGAPERVPRREAR